MPDVPILPGDIVQVTTLGRRGALVVVEDARPGRVAGYMPFARTREAPTEDVPVRLRAGEFTKVGVAAIATAPLAKAREAALATRLESSSPALSAEPEGDRAGWRVVVRFETSELAVGVLDKRFDVPSCGEALDLALAEVPAGSYVTALSADEGQS